MTAFIPRKAGRFAARLAAVCFLLAGAADAGAQSLSPVNTGATVNSLSFTWGDAGPFVIALSTASDFSALTATGTLNAAPTTYVNLSQDERYYFRVKRSGDPDTAYAGNQLSTVTLAAAPSGIYFESTNFASESAASAQVGIGWNVNGNPEWTSYLVSYSKDPGMAGAYAFQEPYPPVSLGGLEANTTYYFSLRARNMADVYTSSTPVSSTATLALSLPSVNTAIYQTSATVSWTPLSGAAQSQRAEGYGLTLSVFPTLVPQMSAWNTSDNTVSSVTLSGLDRNSAYYYRVGTLNISGAMNSDYVRSFTTLTSTTGLSLLDRSTQTARLAWTALPQSPSSATASGYLLEASSTGFSGGAVLSTSTYDITLSTLSLSGILANTTYYFRVGTLNLEGVPNYSGRLSTITLSVPLSAGLLSTELSSSSIRVRIDSPLPASPAESSCEGYLLQASSVNFTGGSVVYSSFSLMSAPAALAIGGLRSNTLYHLRMATLNWDGTPNHTALPDATTLVAAPLSSVSMNGIWESSAAVSFPRLDSDGYVLEASTRPAFIPVFASSATMDPAATGLTVIGLDENTVYYFRAGALYNGTTVYTSASPGSMSTLALRLGSPAKAGVFRSSISVSWTPLPVVSQDTNAESYKLEASTSPGFETVSFSSETFNTALGGLCLEGLAPNTSYYLRAATLNWDGAGNYSYISGTSTLAETPAQQQFTSLSTGSMTVNWFAPLNPADTVYLVRLSSDPGLSAPPVFSSTTMNQWAAFTGLAPNTTYYPEVTAFNRLGVPDGPHLFSPIATIAYDPVPGSYAALGVSSVSFNWSPGDNPPGTSYLAEISSGAGFPAPVISSVTLNSGASFTGLLSDTSYYLRVAANNHSGLPTAPISVGTVLTLPATAYILSPSGTFSDIMTDGFKFSWAGNGNSSLTIYEIDASTASDFNSAASSASASVQGLSHTFRDLLLNTEYWVRIRTRGQAGALTDFVSAGSTGTLLSNIANALVTTDNLVTLQTSYGVISVRMPFGSLGGSTRISIRPESELPPPTSHVSAMRPTGVGLEITAFPQVLVLNPITITLPYRVSDLPAGIDAAKLVLALYDETRNVWVPLPSVSYPAENKVVGQTWHLSTFQLMEVPEQVSLDGVKVYPNPFTPSSVSGVMHFDNLPPYAGIKIYTFLGELVRDITADANGMAYWDGDNAGGRKTASGVYIALLRTQDKKSKKIVKIIIER